MTNGLLISRQNVGLWDYVWFLFGCKKLKWIMDGFVICLHLILMTSH